ncbi:MAG: FAD-dependent oxidoreductase [Desulfovibrio sp.]|nr:MAG: FAD-dependent oxidoreductase [Desulfovibrio sp.]
MYRIPFGGVCLSPAVLIALLVTVGLAASAVPCSATSVAEVEIEEHHEVIVVGAGIAGLSAATFLAEDGWEVLVLEKNDRPGGRTVSGQYRGVSYPLGTEYLGEPEGALQDLISLAGVDLLEIPAPMDAVYHDGEFHVGEAEITHLMVDQGGLEEFNDFAETVMDVYSEMEDNLPELTPLLAELDRISARQWFAHSGFPQFYADKYNVTSIGLFGANLGEISALSAIPEIGFDFEGFSPLDQEDLQDWEDEEQESSGAYSFAGGITDLTGALAARLEERLRLQATVKQVVRMEEEGEEYFLVTYEDGSGGVHTLSSDAVVMAVPAPVALAIGEYALSEEQQSLIAEIPFAPFVTAAFFSEEPIWEEAFDLAVPDGWFFTDVYDGTWMAKAADPRVAESGVHIICVYIGPTSFANLAILNMEDQELLDAVFGDLERLFPGVRDKVTGHAIHRFRYAYPIMTPGAYSRLARLNELNREGVYLAGDWMLYPTFEAAAESGRLAARGAAEYLD